MNGFFTGILLGFGAAIPVGPLTLEVFRRSLRFGVMSGLFLGLGAIISDISYLTFISLGMSVLIKNKIIIRIIGIIGSIILSYFGYRAIFDKASCQKAGNFVKKTVCRQIFEGFIIAFFNPLAFLFWFSLSGQISVITNNQIFSIIMTGLGIIISTISWFLFLCFIVRITRKKMTEKVIKTFNLIGGVLLFFFAFFSFYKSIF